MKKLFTMIVTFGLLLVPFVVYGQSEQTATNAPPVGQALTPEGDFALRLVEALKLGTSATETEAEDTLTNAGIAPKNGWISDYPMTPIIISFMFAPPDGHDVKDKYKAFKEATDRDSVGKGVEGYLDRR